MPCRFPLSLNLPSPKINDFFLIPSSDTPKAKKNIVTTKSSIASLPPALFFAHSSFHLVNLFLSTSRHQHSLTFLITHFNYSFDNDIENVIALPVFTFTSRSNTKTTKARTIPRILHNLHFQKTFKIFPFLQGSMDRSRIDSKNHSLLDAVDSKYQQHCPHNEENFGFNNSTGSSEERESQQRQKMLLQQQQKQQQFFDFKNNNDNGNSINHSTINMKKMKQITNRNDGVTNNSHYYINNNKLLQNHNYSLSVSTDNTSTSKIESKNTSRNVTKRISSDSDMITVKTNPSSNRTVSGNKQMNYFPRSLSSSQIEWKSDAVKNAFIHKMKMTEQHRKELKRARDLRKRHADLHETFPFCITKLVSAVKPMSSCKLKTQVYNEWLMWAAEKQDWKLISKIIKEMKENKVNIDSITYTSIISIIGSHGHLHIIEKIFNNMVQSGVKPTKITFTAIILACTSARNAEKGKKYFDLMLASCRDCSTTSLGAYLRCLVETGNFDSAINLLTDSSFPKNNIHFTTVISGLTKFGKSEVAKSLFLKMKELGVVPTLQTYSALINGMGTNYREAQTLLQEMVESKIRPDAKIYELVMGSFAKNGKLTEAFDLYNEMRAAKVSPSPTIYNSLIHACAKATQINRAFVIYEAMKASRVPVTVSTYLALANACLSVGASDDRAQHVEKKLTEYLKRSGQSSPKFEKKIIQLRKNIRRRRKNDRM